VKNRWRYLISGVVILALLAACGGGDDSDAETASEPPDTEESGESDEAGEADEGDDGDAEGDADDEADPLGGADAAAEMDSLYQAAIDADATDVVVYGPGEDDKGPVYDLFMERFPEITVRGEYLVGPNMDSKINAEFASGVHVASVLQSGDTSLAPKVPTDDEEGLLEEFVPVTAEGLDPQFHDAERQYAFAASATTFGILYNDQMVSEDEVPQAWEDLLDPAYSGNLVWDDPTRFGAGIGFLNKILNDDRYDESFVEDLRANEVYLEASAPAAGNAVATGQFAVQVAYPYSFYLRDAERGAPVDFVFPVEGGNHLSPHFLGLVQNAPSPDAGKLLITWMLSPEGQRANAAVGYYPTMPGIEGPEGNPPVDELDLLAPIPLAETNAAAAANLPVVQDIWGETNGG
jgi:iron(III) transport system substrate-binding protein